MNRAQIDGIIETYVGHIQQLADTHLKKVAADWQEEYPCRRVAFKKRVGYCYWEVDNKITIDFPDLNAALEWYDGVSKEWGFEIEFTLESKQ